MYLFEFSGEDPALARSELRALVEAYGCEWKVVREHASGILLEGVGRIAPALVKRLALTRRVAKLACEAPVGRIDLLEFKVGKKRFAVVPRKVEPITYSMHNAVVGLGASILAKNKGSKVDLGNPQVRVHLFGSRDRLYATTEVREVDRKSTDDRAPKLRPIQSPVSMHPRFCRAMVNLARTKPKGVVLDPFCGTGGTLLEASEMGMRAYGIDIEEKMVFASKENLRFFGLEGSVAQGDSTMLAHALMAMHVKEVDAIVSDLPYGRSTTLAGKTQRELVLQFAVQARETLRSGGFMVLCTNDESTLANAISRTGLRVVERFERRVHRSLTRYIFVINKSN